MMNDGWLVEVRVCGCAGVRVCGCVGGCVRDGACVYLCVRCCGCCTWGSDWTEPLFAVV